MRSYIIHIIFLLLSVFLHYEGVFAQKHLNEGNKYYDRNMFEESIPYYLKEIESGKKIKYKNEAREMLANSYRLTGRFLEATEMYKVILDKSSKNSKADNYLNYASSLKNAAKYEEASEMFKKYIALAPNDPMGKVYLESCLTAQKWLDAESQYFVKNEELVNTSESEYSAVFFKDGIVFSSARPDSKKKFINLSDNINVMRSDLYYMDLKKSKDGVAVIENFSGLNSHLHDGTATFSADGKEVYFARTITGSKNKKTNVVLNSLQIYYSKMEEGGVWSEPVSAFSFNNEKYSVAQASLAKDGKRIYFVSDMPGGYGNTDIYYTELQTDKTWGKPVNLGPAVNTFGHELFPYIYSEDTMYFSSDIHPGMGKLDIFRVVYADNEWKDITNMGTPINSIGDDFGIVFDKTQTMGFFTSDRFNGKGKEDLYTFHKNGFQHVYIKSNKIQIPDNSLYTGITYRIAEEGGPDPVSMVSDGDYYTHELKEGVNYTVTLRREGFFYDALRVRIYRSPGDTCLIADVQSRNLGFIIGGVVTESEMSITMDRRLKEGSKKIYETYTDTVIIENPISEVLVALSRNESLVNKTNTDDKGLYIFPDTLVSGKPYTLIALKSQIPETITEEPVQEVIQARVEKDTVIPVQEIITIIDTSYIIKPVEEIKVPVTEPEPVAINIVQEEIPVIIPQAEVTTTPVEQIQVPVSENYLVKGTIIHSKENKSIAGCEIKIYQGDVLVENTKSDSKGTVNLSLTKGMDYSMYVSKEGFFQSKTTIGGEIQNSDTEILKIYLDPIEYNKPIALNNILFDFNKYTLRKESILELNRLVEFLNLNPELTIELNAHTDIRGDYYTNLLISYKRAEATREYLLLKGIDEVRIYANGFGETFPKIKNIRTEADHEQNRRVEFRVINNDNENFSQTGFSILSGNAYSAENPIPSDIPLPEGLAYRIRLGSYKKVVPFDTFKGVFPVVQEWDEQKEVYNYYAGFFSSKQAANNALQIAKHHVTEDVYLQAYHNNTPITHAQANAISGDNETTIVSAPPVAQESKTLPSIDKGMPGFSIQIGAFRNKIQASDNNEFRSLAGEYGLYVNKFNGYTIYSIGDFKNYTEAFEAKQKLANEGISNEWFIIALLKGQKIPVNEAIGIIERFETGMKANSSTNF